jgi:hypothetical protein
MLKLGIPKDAVKHKMILDGLDATLLDNKASVVGQSIHKHTPPPPMPLFSNGPIPPPPPPPMHGNGNRMGSQSGPVKITTDMLSLVKLKSGQRELSDRTPDKLPQERSGFKVDLNDILNMKSKLKKRNQESEPDSYSKMFASSTA